ncbi:MAG: hypothetical protein ACODAQ_09460 [Phycisphaeraceae bacterium]
MEISLRRLSIVGKPLGEHHHLRSLLEPYLGADGRLTADVLCPHCQYNLRGVSPEGSCPECGAAILQSLADIQMRLRQCGRCIAASHRWLISALPVAGVLLVVMLLVPPQPGPPPRLVHSLFHVLWWAPTALTAIGWVLFTAAVPAGSSMPRGLSMARITTRLTTLPALVLMASSFSFIAEAGRLDLHTSWNALIGGFVLAGMLTPWLYHRHLTRVLRQALPTARLQALWLAPTSLLALELAVYLTA